ncbi:MAG: hypothetical protein JRI97_10420, partial [Deltaproteobacteria bacterium]|nr:hypothetical protein [Deltaproteobacteria bacterium]
FAVWAFLLAVFPPFRTPILWTGLILLFVLTFYTVVQRMIVVHGQLKPSEKNLKNLQTHNL